MAPVTLSDLATIKGILQISNTNSDSLLTSMLAAASGAIQRYCNRNFQNTTVTENYNGSGTYALFLNQRPITGVTSVVINGVTIPRQPDINAYGWTFDNNCLYLVGGYFQMGIQNISVTYTGGLAVSPSLTPDLWDACAWWVAMEYQAKGRIGLNTQSLDGQTTSFLISKMPYQVRIVLDQYRSMAQVQPFAL